MNTLSTDLHISRTFLFTRRKGTLRVKTENNSKSFRLAPRFVLGIIYAAMFLMGKKAL